jgi:hypothetical protein
MNSLEIRLLQTRAAVARLRTEAFRLARSIDEPANATQSPDYFLARTSPQHHPKVVSCYDGGALIGVLYAYEVVARGIRTGFIFGGDETGRGLVLARPALESDIVARSCEQLLASGMHALRFNWRVREEPLIAAPALASKGVKMWCCSRQREGDWLVLEPAYEQFLKRLGSHTRRNMRLYRRKADEMGYCYIPRLSLREYQAAVVDLNVRVDYPTDHGRDERDSRFFDLFPNAIRAGIRDRYGRFLALIAGVVYGGVLHVLTQFNDVTQSTLSISLVLRGHLIEDLIGHGFTAIHFVNGVSAMLGRSCEPALLRTLSIDRRSHPAGVLKWGCSRLAGALDRRNKPVSYRLQYLAGSYLADSVLATFSPMGFPEHII